MQRYVSKELTHFVGKNKREIKDETQRKEEQYKILLDIIKTKCISSHHDEIYPVPKGRKYCSAYNIRFDMQKKFSEGKYDPLMVCFCDIPVGDLGIHINKYSPFGLSFNKSFLIEFGANPVLYVEKNSAITYHYKPNTPPNRDSTRSEYYDELVDIFEKHCISPISSNLDPNKQPALSECSDIGYLLFNLLCYVKFFDSNRTDNDEENYYMEREWRTPYEVHFEINNIYRIILPKDFSERFRKDVPEYTGQITFSDDYEKQE